MAVAGLPVGAQTVQRQAQATRAQIGEGFVGQQQETTVVDDQRQAAAALFVAPADPRVAGAQATGGGAEDQHAEPVAVGVGDGLPELFTDGADVAQVMMLGQQPSGAGFGLGRGEQLDLGQSVGLGLCGGASASMHARRMKNLEGQCAAFTVN